MHDITCPHCATAFKIDESGYADIVKQVRDSEFDQQMRDRLELAEQDKQSAIALAKTQVTAELHGAGAAKEVEIQRLKSQLDAAALAQQHAVTAALVETEKERDGLMHALRQANSDKQAAAHLADATLVHALQQTTAAKDSEIQGLTAKLDAIALRQQISITEAVGVVEKQRDALKNNLDRSQLEKQLAESAL